MRHLIVCCDGTWNSAEQARDGVPTPTNVRMFHNLLDGHAADGAPQVRQYFSGVGVDGSHLARSYDGGTGHGLSHNIMNAYLWLAQNYRPGDALSFVGFSRGAFTVRSLVGMITRCGLVTVPEPDPDRLGVAWRRVRQVFEDGYVPGAKRKADWGADLTFHEEFGCPADDEARVDLGSKIEFLGVWDTVGALGIPDSMAMLNVFDRPQRYAFHDTHLNTGIKCARHALALDERRGPFAPTLWTTEKGEPLTAPNVVQMWFPGVHSDVGGGYRETDLSDGALHWMIDEAEQHAGLRFDDCAHEIKGDPRGVLHESCTSFYEWQASVPRATPRVHVGSTRVHVSAKTRFRQAPLRQDPYRRSVELDPGRDATVPVLAHLPWNETGLYLRQGRYRFRAQGEWIDRNEPSSPDGVRSPEFVRQLGYAVGDLAGLMESSWQVLSRNPAGNVLLSKRVERVGKQDARWMQLVVVIANGGFDEKGLPKQHQVELVGCGPIERYVHGEGYLYAFANDAWGMYGNNRGSVALTVQRLQEDTLEEEWQAEHRHRPATR